MRVDDCKDKQGAVIMIECAQPGGKLQLGQHRLLLIAEPQIAKPL